MPRFNVEHNGKWACFSTIPELFITNFVEKSEYENWRLEEYGRANYIPVEQCNKYSISEAIFKASLNHSKEEVIENLVNEAGLEQAEAETLWEAHRNKETEE